ncbi:DNA replication protein psf1 [Steccherinum ochraceum]|uniref:DNA replication complex GINS protein PSF1 n=1 Tax=Steccherinum ochraceum TaxID=92696 RepID=A0A4R0RLM4_9APHY|nr:DNA replication protein psf1 [Steccherinum ochraceum]
MNDSVKQYGELATQLLTESRRSTATDTLLKYNDVLVRSILREQRQLEALIQDVLARQDDGASLGEDPDTPTILLYQTAILRNKRCLLAYHHHRLERLKDMFWAVGGALPLLLSTHSTTSGGNSANGNMNSASNSADVRSKLSPHEVDFLRSYSDSLLEFRSGVLATEEVDLFAPITRPPKDLHVLVRVVKDCGVIQTEVGAIDFRRGQRFLVRRADVEHLIVQGYLEEV